MKKLILHIIIVLFLITGCTQIVTAPISIAGSTIDTIVPDRN